MSHHQLRRRFLEYFRKQHNHRIIPSSGLVPNDSSLLFSNAGMVQFKDQFINPPSSKQRLTSVQKCMRVGGKHNDLENVGFTPRHHTFFEMLGNFSINDYFKEQAIVLAWEFVSCELQLPHDRIRVTVFKNDPESEMIWRKLLPTGVPIIALDEEENFWSMGDGLGVPCGPCTEIFYDTRTPAGFLEIWNLVFMEYKTGENNSLEKLPIPCVDTGMGLERLASVIQGVDSNFETDLLAPLVSHIQPKLKQANTPFPGRVIADHIRAAAFLLADGVVPSNTGRGYVLRRIIRRAVGFGFRSGLEEPFLTSMLPVLNQTFTSPDGTHIYPELIEANAVINSVIEAEENSFLSLVDDGMKMLLKADNIDAELAFKLYDTFGFPLDLTCTIAREQGLSVDVNAFKRLMEQQRTKSGAKSWTYEATDAKKAWKFEPHFTGYDTLEEPEANVLAVDGDWISVSPCPFYAEGGGQVGDCGEIEGVGRVVNTIAPSKGEKALLIELYDGCKLPSVGEKVRVVVDRRQRHQTSVHHTATHLLHSALQIILGEHVHQAGSLVNATLLRFDFTHGKQLTKEQLTEIETFVNNIAEDSCRIETTTMSLEEAKAKNATMLFGEKYDELVRAVEIVGSPSVELCGGTHVQHTSMLFPFKIVSESSVAAGTRRIEAVAGRAALDYLEERSRTLDNVQAIFKTGSPDNIVGLVQNRVKLGREYKKERDKLRIELLKLSQLRPVVENRHTAVYCLSKLCQDEDPKLATVALNDSSKILLKQDPDRAHILVYDQQRVVVCCSEASQKHAGKIIQNVLERVPGKGGGTQTYAQGKFNKSVAAEKLNWELMLNDN